MTDTLERPALKVVGSRPVRPDGVDKVTGRAQYGADFHAPGMLVGRIKRSPHAHARIVSIETRKARALPGVKAIVTSAEMLNLASEEVEGGESSSNLRDLALNVMARREKYLALEAKGARHNLGVKFGVVEAQIALALAGVDRERMLSLLIGSVAKVEQE